MMAYAERVAIVPGYGMAVAQAQHKIWEFAKLLIDRGVKVKFAIHPVARTDKNSPIYGMPILDVAKAKNVIVIKRGRGKGFAGIENALFYADNTRMLYGDGQAAASELVAGLKALDG
jgi:NAD(P) transhydrogenase subunit beta